MNLLAKFSGFTALFLLCGIIYFPFLGEINLFDWDETLIASISREMFEKGEYLRPFLNDQFYLESPPLYFWMQLLSFNYLGINEYAARIPNALCAILVVLTLYKNGQRIYSTSFGMMWGVIYISMFLPQFYHKSGLQEPWFCFFIYLSLYNLTRVIQARQEMGEDFYKKREVFSNLFYSAFAAVGAILTKGLEGYIVILLTYWCVFLFSSAKYGFGYGNIVKWTLYVALMLMIWIGVEFKWHGKEYLVAFFEYQWKEFDFSKASFTTRVSFPAFILFVGCFPASALAFNSFQVKSYESVLQKIFRLTMVSCLILVILITSFFKSKIAHYSILAYYPISYLAAYSLRYILEEKVALRKLTYALILVGGMIWTTALTMVPLTRANLDWLEKYIHEDTLQYALSMKYPWENIEIFIGVLFFSVFLLCFILFLRKKTRLALIILFFSCMMTAEIVMVYYVPKLEQLTQGAQVDFILENKKEKAFYLYYGGTSYLSNFYSENPVRGIPNFSLDSLTRIKNKDIPIYIMTKKSDTASLSSYQNQLQYLYQQGIYSFYKLKI